MKAEELKRIRKLIGYTQAQLAEEIGVSMQAVQLWEYGKRNINKGYEALILQVLDKHKEKHQDLGSQDSVDSLVRNMIEARYKGLVEKLKKLEDKVQQLEDTVDKKLAAYFQDKAQEAIDLTVEAKTKEEFKEVHESIYDLFKRNLTYDKRLDTLESYHQQDTPGSSSAS